MRLRLKEYLSSAVLSTNFPKAVIIGWSMVFLYVTLNVYGALLLKSQVQKIDISNIYSIRAFFQISVKLLSSWQTIVAIGSLFCATGAWMVALGSLELSRAYPVALGLNLLITFLAAIFLFHETLSLMKLIGVGLIVVGIFIVIN